MRKICNLVVFLMLIFLLSSCQAITTETEAETNSNIITTTETKTCQIIDNQTSLNDNLIFDWAEVNYFITTNINPEPRISYATTKQEITKNEYDELRETENSADLSTYVNQFESKQDAISQYENEIGHYYFGGDASYYKYYKYIITGYKLTTYEVKLYKSNYLEIKTIIYDSSDNSITESITGFIPDRFYIEFYDDTPNHATTTTGNSDLFFDWTEVEYIKTINITAYPKINYATTKQEITKNEYEELRSTGTSVNLPNYINQFESKQDAISQYENEIGHYYFMSDNSKYYKYTITGYELTTYEVRLYKSNYLEIKTIKYNSSNNSITESIVGTLYSTSTIKFCK